MEAVPVTVLTAAAFRGHEVEGETIVAALIATWMLGTACFAVSHIAGLVLTLGAIGTACWTKVRPSSGD